MQQREKSQILASKKTACVACGNPTVDRAHIKSRGSGGNDQEWNIMFLCREHHRLQHAKGWLTFSKQYKTIAISLFDKGWAFNEWGKLLRK